MLPLVGELWARQGPGHLVDPCLWALAKQGARDRKVTAGGGPMRGGPLPDLDHSRLGELPYPGSRDHILYWSLLAIKMLVGLSCIQAPASM
jgi:hypothetical protein